MKQYLGYNNSQWNRVQIISARTFNEQVSKTEHGFFKALIAPYIRAYALGGFHPRKDWIFSERRKKLIKEAFRKYSESDAHGWGEENKSTQQDFVFYIEFALLRKKFRKVVSRLINGDTLEKIQNDDFLGDFLLRLKSEYLDLNKQFVIRGNQVKVVPLMIDLPNNTYSATSFLDGYLLPCLSFCFFGYPETDAIFTRIKKCAICDKFFFTKYLKRTKCYSSECEKKYRKLQKREQGKRIKSAIID